MTHNNNTDLDLIVPDLSSLGLTVVREYRDWWYTGIAFKKSSPTPPDGFLLAVTRTMRSGITFDIVSAETIAALDKAKDREAKEQAIGHDYEVTDRGLNGLLGSLRNNAFEEGWSYQDYPKMSWRDWLEAQGW